MPITADILLDRKRLKLTTKKWRAAFFVVLALFGLSLVQDDSSMKFGEKDFIARIKVHGIITDDDTRSEIIKTIRENKHIKAVIVDIDSPGGTVVAGEILFSELRAMAAVKPVAATMGTMAASGGYMTAIGADYIVARYNTITGSVGVILESLEVTELAEKLGIKPLTFKSGPLKAVPSPFEKMTPAADASINNTIQDSFAYFLGIVRDRRQLPPDTVKLISDGRIFTGNQAVKVKLVDAIGGEPEALTWLRKVKKIPESLEVKEVVLHKKKHFWDEYLDSLIGNNFLSARIFSLDGLLAIWHPM